MGHGFAEAYKNLLIREALDLHGLIPAVLHPDLQGRTLSIMHHAVVLRTEALAVEVCPVQGGRISSLRCNASETEFLTRRRSTHRGFVPGMQAQFRDGPCAGIEDCLPTVGACADETEGGAVPDHGDLWQLPWTVLEQAEGVSVRMEARCFSRPLLVRKRVSVHGRTVQLAYEVVNTGIRATSLLFALHPLLAIAGGDRIVLPRGVRDLRLAYQRGGAGRKMGGVVAWPTTAINPRQPDLSVTGSVADAFAAMLYSDRLQHGVCGLYRSQEQQGMLLRFDTATLPYLGIWLCYGGWPEEQDQPPQYAVALEPTTAPCNTLLEAQRTDSAVQLQPGQRVRWQVEMELTVPGQSYTAFLRQLSVGHPPSEIRPRTLLTEPP